MSEAPPPADPVPVLEEAEPAALPLVEVAADGRVVIDLTRLVPPPPTEDCIDTPADPLNSEIVVCAETGPAPRLGPQVGPVDDEAFGSAIPRARIKLSDTASAEANLAKTPVGGFDADGAEAKLKIDF